MNPAARRRNPFSAMGTSCGSVRRGELRTRKSGSSVSIRSEMAESLTLDLSPRTALITGGSRGIGRAAAELLARAGARVAINYRRDESAANSLVRDIRASGGEAMALAGDVAEAEQARQLVRDV